MFKIKKHETILLYVIVTLAVGLVLSIGLFSKNTSKQYMLTNPKIAKNSNLFGTTYWIITKNNILTARSDNVMQTTTSNPKLRHKVKIYENYVRFVNINIMNNNRIIIYNYQK